MIHTDGKRTIANAPHRGQGTPYSAQAKMVPTELRVANERIAELEHELASLRRVLERQL